MTNGDKRLVLICYITFVKNIFDVHDPCIYLILMQLITFDTSHMTPLIVFR